METPKVQAAMVAALALLLCHAAAAQPPAPQENKPAQSAPAKLTSPYRLTLSPGKDWNTDASGLLKPNVELVNSGPYTLRFLLENSLAQFTVEYKATGSDAASDAK